MEVGLPVYDCPTGKPALLQTKKAGRHPSALFRFRQTGALRGGCDLSMENETNGEEEPVMN